MLLKPLFPKTLEQLLENPDERFSELSSQPAIPNELIGAIQNTTVTDKLRPESTQVPPQSNLE